jgi:glycerate kinase
MHRRALYRVLMRVLIAPDSFGSSLSAVDAGEAMAAGWRRRAPDDDLVVVPMSDGGIGFVDAIQARLGGEPLASRVVSHHGTGVPATVLRVDGVAYVEGAQACGAHLGDAADPERASSYGIGQLIAAAIDAGARAVVVGLGDLVVGDGGAGAISALGAIATPAEALRGGTSALGTLHAVELAGLRERVAGVSIVGACDLDIPLLGLRGTTNLTGASRGHCRRPPAARRRAARAARRPDGPAARRRSTRRRRWGTGVRRPPRRRIMRGRGRGHRRGGRARRAGPRG